MPIIRGVAMKRTENIGLLLGVVLIFGIALLWLGKHVRYLDIPPPSVQADVDLLKWMGRPAWVMKHSSTNEIYYEIGRNKSTLLLIVAGSSGPPSYTVDQAGHFIGWSPDSGEVKKPDQIYSNKLIREKVDVDSYIRGLKNRKALGQKK